ncbi:MAG TPA: nucleoside triphosphate pyrophosphohydrolase [Candidatus Angelobacter sp.]|nr:nucleoside triphosphate pyrophosphohydrolase [Candidatus Angelobacter sp.]
MKKKSAIDDLLKVMAKLRSPKGCPWDREQDHMTLRWHAVEEVYELMDAIESGDDHELEEELGDLLLQVVFHCQLAKERGAFDFNKVARHITEKLIRRHPHVFGTTKVKNVDEVWANWEKIKRAEKHGTKHARPSALDGIPKHLPALLRAEKLVKKARKAKLLEESQNLPEIFSPFPSSIWREGEVALVERRKNHSSKTKLIKKELAGMLFTLTQFAQREGWSAENLLRTEIHNRERDFRRKESQAAKNS